jgi:hypothetical protein
VIPTAPTAARLRISRGVRRLRRVCWGAAATDRLSIALLLAVAFACAPFAAAQPGDDVPKAKREAASVWSEEGLEKVNVKGLDVVYARPGASLAGYDKVLLRPISVSFRRNWEKQSLPGTRLPIRAEDSQRIKDRLSVLVHEELVKELGEGGYRLVNGAGDDVLDVDMSIVDLYVAAPDIKTAGRVNTYAVSAGEMTLVAALRDSVSGDIVMRVFDHTIARDSFEPRRITSVENVAEARAAASAWARALRKELDLARGIGARN